MKNAKINTIILLIIVAFLAVIVFMQFDNRPSREVREWEKNSSKDTTGTFPAPTIKACPDEKIINKMPMPCDGDCDNRPANEYYIYKGERREISHFDASWVARNCSVPEQTVY